MSGHGLIIAAPSSGAGKTTVTLGLLRALRRRGLSVRGAKSGPDFIDPAFHSAASGQECVNLDAWSMGRDELMARASGDGYLIVEGAMGLFDGAPPDGKGATADLARTLSLPVILVIDAARLSHSVAAIALGFSELDPEVSVRGVILNNVGSTRHEKMLRTALDARGITILGALPRLKKIAHPSRHLGLVQAQERHDLEQFLTFCAELVEAHTDIDGILGVGRPLRQAEFHRHAFLPGQQIAVARDAAFGFTYSHILQDWRAAGKTLSFFSPLADEPVPDCDTVFLPGGYPELYAGKIAASQRFLTSLRNAAQRSVIYGECGGFMTLGEALIDANGLAHKMASLLPLVTSFETPKRHLGYRRLTCGNGVLSGNWCAHEFHYSNIVSQSGPALFQARDAENNPLPNMGIQISNVMGSYAHIIAPCAP